MLNIGVKLKTIDFGSQLESCKNYPLTMGFFFEYLHFMKIVILHEMRSIL